MYEYLLFAQVKQIMEEAVTRKFVHQDSSSVTSLCGNNNYKILFMPLIKYFNPTYKEENQRIILISFESLFLF